MHRLEMFNDLATGSLQAANCNEDAAKLFAEKDETQEVKKTSA